MSNKQMSTIKFPNNENIYDVVDAEARSTIDTLSTIVDNNLGQAKSYTDTQIANIEIDVDSTLSLSGEAADAAVVGSKFNQILSGFSIVPAMFHAGNISTSGTITTNDINRSNYYSDIIQKSEFESIKVVVSNARMMSYCTYQDNGTFISRSSWTDSGTVIIPNTYNVRLIVCTSAVSEYLPIATILSGYSFTINGGGGLINNAIETSKAYTDNRLTSLNNNFTNDFPGKIFHNSFDDTWACLYNLITNTYNSIFEEPFFAKLKTIHDATGAVFTLNTFNYEDSQSNYNISNVPTTYQQEFQANKNWIKFAFHADSTLTNYNTATGAATAYNKFVAAIYKLTGDYDCIDRFTRLGYFGGNLENCQALRDCNYGITGLLGADNQTRESYYLTNEQNYALQTKGKFYDMDNNLYHIKTLTRNLGSVSTELNANIQYQKYAEVFNHEYSWSVTETQSLNQWATNNGYIHAYPSLLFATATSYPQWSLAIFKGVGGTATASAIKGSVGTSTTITITPNTGYQIDVIKFNGSTLTNATTLTLYPHYLQNELKITFKTTAATFQ